MEAGIWKLRIVMIPTLLSQMALEIVIMTSYYATSVNKVGIMAILDL